MRIVFLVVGEVMRKRKLTQKSAYAYIKYSVVRVLLSNVLLSTKHIARTL
jgi:hypothetical protein